MDPKGKDKSLVEFAGEDTVYQCPYCSRAPRGFDNLKLHMTLAHNTKKILSCTHCSYQTLVNQNLVNHKVEVHPKLSKHACPKCNFQTWDMLSLSKHKCEIKRALPSQIPPSIPDFSKPSVELEPKPSKIQKMPVKVRPVSSFSHRPSIFNNNTKSAESISGSPSSTMSNSNVNSNDLSNAPMDNVELNLLPSNKPIKKLTNTEVLDRDMNSTSTVSSPAKDHAEEVETPKVAKFNGKIKFKLKSPQKALAVINRPLKIAAASEVSKNTINPTTHDNLLGNGKEVKANSPDLTKPLNVGNLNQNGFYTCDHCQYVTPKLAGRIMKESIIILGLNVHVRKAHGEEFSNNQDKKFIESLFCVTKNPRTSQLTVHRVGEEDIAAILTRINEAQRIVYERLLQMVNQIIKEMKGPAVEGEYQQIGFNQNEVQMLIFITENCVTKEKEYYEVYKGINKSLLTAFKETSMTVVNGPSLTVLMESLMKKYDYESPSSSSMDMITA